MLFSFIEAQELIFLHRRDHNWWPGSTLHKLAAAHLQAPERQIDYHSPMKTVAYNKFNNNVNLPKSLQCLFQSKTDNVYNTRRLYNLKINFSKSKIKYNCLSSIGVRLWNKLDEKMKTSGSLIKFKKMLKLTYVNNY